MKQLLLLLFILWTAGAWAQGQGIPTSYMNDPAVDLVKDGVLLMPDDVHALKKRTKGRFDISTLNPQETSDLWKNTYLKELPLDKNPLGDMDEVSYHSPVLSPSGIFRFNITNKLGDGKLYTMMLSKQVHSVLLAKSLLRKLGYQIPDIKYLPRIILSFKDEQEKKGFISYLENVAFAGASEAWVIEELEDNKLMLQDLVVMESNHPIYNLAVGVTSEMIQGRRLMSSLVVPLSIVHLEESVNMFRWNAGVIANNTVSLYRTDADEFQCTWDDARWISRRIEKLTREDWKQIVESTNLPKPVQQILTEKLISRRNSVMKLFKIDAEEFKVDGKLSNGVELVDGKITQQNWPGYASRFAFGDPDSPLADSEIKSWVKSRAVSTVMDLIVGQINQLPYLGTDINKLFDADAKEFVEKLIKKSVEEKKPAEIPVKAWIHPVVRGKVILSRNIVTGTYLGTDNLVQLADTVGVAISGGVAVNTMGVTAGKPMNIRGEGGYPLSLGGTAAATLVRTYSHLRPVISIEGAMKYPFVNILVPIVKRDFGKKLHEATLATINPELSEDQKAEAVAAALKPFTDSIQVGESLVVTDTLTTQVGASLGASYKKLVSASLGIAPGYMVLSRFHVHRKSEEEFHIYKDLGHAASYSVNFGLDSLVPVLNLSVKKSTGGARVKFYSLNLNPKNPEALKNASALRRAIVASSTREVEDIDKKPFIIKHTYKESTPEIHLLFWQWLRQNASNDVTVINPAGDERYFRRHYYGRTKGRNYQAYANALINHWVGLLFQEKANLSESMGKNPGYTFKGRAQSKFLTLDQEVDKEGTVIEPFVKLTRIHNGWSIDRKRAEEILEDIKHKYRFEFYNAPVLNDTYRIFLYNISLNIFFYKTGIEHLMRLSEDEIKAIFRSHKAQKHLVIAPADVDDSESGVKKFLRLFKRFKKYEAKGKEDKANKYLLKAMFYADDNLTFAGLAGLVGGLENIYMNSKIDGFREGDEDGDRAIISNSLGEIGSPRIFGPLATLQKQTQMLEGEFYIYWMMQRLN